MKLSLPYRFLSRLAALLVLLAGASGPAFAARHHHAARAPAPHGANLHHRGVVGMPANPTDPEKDAALIVDGATGKVLFARNETAERHPASLTKMMTLYLLFDALKQGKLTMQTPLRVSYHASIQKPTKLGLRPGQTIPVDLAIRAIVIRSANDVAVVIAEALGGTESHFAEMMTAKARQIGMRETNYHNASGLPDPLQISTAADLAVLGRHVAYDFPQYFPYFGLAGFKYQKVWYPTHDNLIGRYDGADGIKTGYTGASGFNLVSSVTRGTTHLIAVVMGGRTAVRRDMEMVRLLDQTFAQIGANPMMVARATLPRQHVAQKAPRPAIAGFSLPQVTTNKFASLAPMPSTVQNEDEDAAEKVRAPDENFSVIHGEAAKPPAPAPQTPPPQAKAPAPAAKPPAPMVAAVVVPKGPIPSVRPTARPDTVLAAAQSNLVKSSLVKVAVNAPRPQMRPSLREDGEGDSEPAVPVPAPGRNWTIQIGAYADRTLARNQLAAYAGKAQDVLARAAKIISPVQTAEGHTMYRARFGLFAEREARDVCSQLTQRGQTCFAAVQTR
jgi:D-alanyl-D-alanine carboxypeptidase